MWNFEITSSLRYIHFCIFGNLRLRHYYVIPIFTYFENWILPCCQGISQYNTALFCHCYPNLYKLDTRPDFDKYLKCIENIWFFSFPKVNIFQFQDFLWFIHCSLFGYTVWSTWVTRVWITFLIILGTHEYDPILLMHAKSSEFAQAAIPVEHSSSSSYWEIWIWQLGPLF